MSNSKKKITAIKELKKFFKTHYIDGNKYIYKGSILKGKINGSYVEGKLQIEDGEFFFCQNMANGSNCKDKLGYSNSWVFNTASSEVFIEEECFTPINTVIDLGIEFTIRREEDGKSRLSLFIGDSKSTYPTIKLTHSSYPACCGSTILSHFLYDSFQLSRLRKKLESSEVSLFYLKKIILKFAGTSNINCILRKDWPNLVKIFEMLEFKRIDTFENSNTGNTLYIYSYTRKEDE